MKALFEFIGTFFLALKVRRFNAELKRDAVRARWQEIKADPKTLLKNRRFGKDK